MIWKSFANDKSYKKLGVLESGVYLHDKLLGHASNAEILREESSLVKV